MNKRISVGVAVSLVLIAVAITFTAATIFSMNQFDSKVSSASQRATFYDKLSEIEKIVRSNYYGDIDDTALYTATAEGYISGLGDVGSQYLTAEQIAAREASMNGTTVGFGIGVERNASGYMVINRVTPDSSADSMGLQTGDIITKIDDLDVLSIGYDAAYEMLGGTEGSTATIVYNRSGSEETVELTRTTTESTSVVYTKIDDIGYIRVDAMNSTTAAQFSRVITEAQTETDISGIVVDLRDTSGGYDISVAASMLEAILPSGPMINGRYKDDELKTLFTSSSSGISSPLAVLINENTTGFTELIAAVVADEYENGVVVGKTSAGRGTLQQLVKLSDGSGVDITVAELLTPSGTSFDGVGVTPRYEVDAGENFILTTPPDELSDAQYARAAEALRAMS